MKKLILACSILTISTITLADVILIPVPGKEDIRLEVGSRVGNIQTTTISNYGHLELANGKVIYNPREIKFTNDEVYISCGGESHWLFKSRTEKCAKDFAIALCKQRFDECSVVEAESWYGSSASWVDSMSYRHSGAKVKGIDL